MLIRDLMQTEVATLRVDDTPDLANDIMELVVEHGRLVGLVSETDLLRCLARVLDISEAKSSLPEFPQ